MLSLVRATHEHLPSYVAALERGWSPDTERGQDAAREELAAIRRDADAFLAGLVDPVSTDAVIVLPDGSSVARLPGARLWLWDEEFCGLISLRWQRGTADLPPYCLGHIGYSVVPWKRRRGYATEALRQVLPRARAEGLPYVDITTDPSNVASRRVIEANGGVLLERFTKPRSHGSGPGLRYRIQLS